MIPCVGHGGDAPCNVIGMALTMGKALVERNTYECYSVRDDVDPIPKYMVEFPKGKFNGLRAYYNICTDPDLGFGLAALCCDACGCNACKQQLAMQWLPGIDMYEQPHYALNQECKLWGSYEGANDWRIVELKPMSDERGHGIQHDVH